LQAIDGTTLNDPARSYAAKLSEFIALTTAATFHFFNKATTDRNFCRNVERFYGSLLNDPTIFLRTAEPHIDTMSFCKGPMSNLLSSG
jgi:hypothetical protein